MARRLTIIFLLFVGLGSTATAQTTLTDLDFVNNQITGPGVYLVESGKAYAFDGQIDLTFEITIQGPDDGWIYEQTSPPVLVNTPGSDGAARNFLQLQAGGILTLKNLVISGRASNDAVSGQFVGNTAGSGYTADNVAFVDWQSFAFRNQGKNLDISITNCVFINGMGLGWSPWGGFPMRMDVAGENVTIENNTVVNSGRLLGNSGPWFNARLHEIHNTYMNSMKAGHEQRAFENIQANNIYYNFDFLGRKTTDNTYDAHWTTWNYYSDVVGKLDSVSLYLGQNLFYRQQEIINWFETAGPDSTPARVPGLLWEHASVDSFITNDDDYTIGTNYGGPPYGDSETNPGFAVPPSNLAKQVEFLGGYWDTTLRPGDQNTEWIDWRVPSPVTWDAGTGLPVLNWPPAFDLSYTNPNLLTAGTDGLPLGDLNWFPEAKADYLANRDQYIAALRDSITNAKAVYVPGSPTPFLPGRITSVEESFESILPSDFSLEQNYPNPFNPTTNIVYNLTQVSDVKLTVYSLLGQRVSVLINSEMKPAGKHTVKWDGRDDSGKLVPSGVYIYKIEVGDIAQTKKMLLMK